MVSIGTDRDTDDFAQGYDAALRDEAKALDDLEKRIAGLEAMLCDAQREVEDMREALRPFAEAYRAGSFGDGAHPHDMVHVYLKEAMLARAAELVPATSPPPSAPETS